MNDIFIQTEDFNQQSLYEALAHGTEAGAVVTFVGRVREFDEQQQTLFLEHYPAMTEKVLAQIIAQARKQWPILQVKVVHRIGELKPSEQIVFVGVSAAHRGAAFAACEYIIDFLKTEAPFWKKEGQTWVKAKHQDQQKANAWHE